MSATRIQPLGRVVSAEDAGLYADAAGALLLAQRQAKQLLDSAALDAAAARKRALVEAQREAEASLARTLAEAGLRSHRELLALRPLLADAIADGVALILGARPEQEATAAAAAHAVASLQDRTGVVVRVPPAQVPAVSAAFTDGSGVRVQADATLRDGDCVIETAAGFVRAGIADQLGRLRDALHAAAMEQA